MNDNLAKGNTTDIGLGGNTSSSPISGDWNLDQAWWRANFRDRPYVSVDRRFEEYEPSLRFGYHSANRYRGQNWNDVEHHLKTDWEAYEGRGESTWEHVKESVRDAWDNVTGKR
jgi:hypothetical protein